MRSLFATLWRGMAPGTPHFVRDYNRVTLWLGLRHRNEGLKLAVGGDFEAIGMAERNVLLRHGLSDGMFLLDVGCGSGRLAYALRNMKIEYLGTDVVPQLLNHAQEITKRPDWQFIKVAGLSIPAADRSADFVTFFSVFTHLRHEESYAYLTEAKRVLKPGGRIVFSYLDFTIPDLWPIFASSVNNVGKRAARISPMNEFMSRDFFPVWADRLGLELVAIEGGAIGQSVCVMRKLDRD